MAGIATTITPAAVLAIAAVLTSAAWTARADAASLRFYGNGASAPGLDRVEILIDQVGNSLPGPPADVGAGDFTIEWWMKAAAADNAAGAVSCGDNINWIYGNIAIDRDRFSQGRKFGISLAGGRVVFGVSTESADRTVCGSTPVADDAWHHVAVQRDADTGALSVWVDGALDAGSTGPAGDISYPDDGVPCANCCGGGSCNGSDPYLVLGAEKHDAGLEYPAYSGFMDELRLSTVVRYAAPFVPPTAPFAPDASTAALYHFDEGSGDLVADSSGAAGGPSDGQRLFGGSPAGPQWASDSPFADPDDLDGDGKDNASDECTVLVGAQRMTKAKLDLAGLSAPLGEQGHGWKGSFRPAGAPDIDPSADGLHLYVEDDGGVVLDIAVPGGLSGVGPACDLADGWSVSGSATKRVYRYRNVSGFLDSGCSVEAGGIEQIKIIDLTSTASPKVRYQVKASNAAFVLSILPARLSATVGLAAAPGPEQASAAAMAGACGTFEWDPLTTSAPLPYCKPSPAVSPDRLQCKTP